MRAFLSLTVIVCVATAASGFSLSPTDVVFHFYSRANPTVSQPLFPTAASIMTANINIFGPIIITVHDQGDSVGGNFNAHVIPAHLNSNDVNIFAVDWSSGSAMYTEALGNAPQCGEVIASFVNILINEFGLNSGLLTIVGVGVGAHVAGIAGRNIVSPVPHIVALDPSLVGWTHHPEILNPDDANVVEVLHTTAGNYGYDYPLGDIDFYSNGGSHQTGCGSDSTCSHMYSYIYYAESITSEANGGTLFVGTACEDYENAINLSCNGDRDVVFGGTADKSDVSGIYTFLTNAQQPFARG
ncbi:pancreatic triacylglycerol lipase [Aphomia sociella]